MEELGVLDSDWCRVETSNGIVCDVSGKVLARLEYDSKTVSLTLRLVNVTLAELEKLVRRVAYRDVNENINGLDRRSVSVFVRTGQSFSRTLVDISVVPLPLRYNGPKSISVRKGGAEGPSSSCAPFADVTLVPGCFRKGCSGFVKISGVLEYEAVSALWMGIAVEANHYSNGGVVFSPQSSGDVHVMIGSKKIALMHAKRHVVTFTLTADLPKPEDALRVVLAAIRVHGEEGTFDEEATLNVTDGQVKCQAAVRVNSS
jgi:hypothetical protein